MNLSAWKSFTIVAASLVALVGCDNLGGGKNKNKNKEGSGTGSDVGSAGAKPLQPGRS